MIITIRSARYVLGFACSECVWRPKLEAWWVLIVPVFFLACQAWGRVGADYAGGLGGPCLICVFTMGKYGWVCWPGCRCGGVGMGVLPVPDCFVAAGMGM